MSVWETKIDVCRIVQGVRGSIISKVMFENAFKASSRSIECPIPRGNVTITNLLITNNFLPPFPGFMFPSGVFEYYFQCTVKGILKNKKKYVRLYDYEVYGRAFNADKFNTSV